MTLETKFEIYLKCAKFSNKFKGNQSVKIVNQNDDDGSPFDI